MAYLYIPKYLSFPICKNIKGLLTTYLGIYRYPHTVGCTESFQNNKLRYTYLMEQSRNQFFFHHRTFPFHFEYNFIEFNGITYWLKPCTHSTGLFFTHFCTHYPINSQEFFLLSYNQIYLVNISIIYSFINFYYQFHSTCLNFTGRCRYKDILCKGHLSIRLFL